MPLIEELPVVEPPKKHGVEVTDLDQIDPKNPPTVTRFCLRHAMCGLCQFRCCLTQTFNAECTEEESQRLGLPRVFPLNGHCRCLAEDGTGCIHGPNRPNLCKVFPVRIKDGKLTQYYWSVVTCPQPKDYILDKIEDGKYHYHPKPMKGGNKKNNLLDHVVLDYPIEKFPNIFEMGAEGLEHFYGKEAVQKMREDLARLKEDSEGFGL